MDLKLKRKISYFLVSLFLFVLSLAFFPISNHSEFLAKSFHKTEQKNESFLVKRVVDGDTILLENGERVRYIGIDAPESVHPEKPVECFGKDASERNRELVEGKTVTLKKDVSERDAYGRLLRYVYIGDLFVNRELVSEGYAKAYSKKPDTRYREVFLEAQRSAKAENLGLWGSCAAKAGMVSP